VESEPCQFESKDQSGSGWKVYEKRGLETFCGPLGVMIWTVGV
jgi:hypothetical protein